MQLIRSRAHDTRSTKRSKISTAATLAAESPRSLLIAFILAGCATTQAATYTWQVNAGGTYNWSTASNWGGSVPNSGSAVVVFEDGTNLSGAQTIIVNNQACGELLLGDLGGNYRQVLSGSSGNPGPVLNMGTSGGTALIYPDGGSSDPGILLPIALSSCGLKIQSYYQSLSGNTNPSNSATENISITDGITGCTNLEVNHAVVDIGNAVAMTGNTTLDGGYASLTFDTNNVLPTTTNVTISDTTDTLNMNGTSQAVASITGTGVIDLPGSNSILSTLTNATTFAGHLAGNGSLAVNGSGTLTLTGNNATAFGSYGAFGGSIEVGPTGFSFGAGLSVNNDSALGLSSTIVILQGGTLYTTASFTMPQEVNIPSQYVGYVSPSSGTTLNLTGPVGGGGELIMNGAGTLVLGNSVSDNASLSAAGGTTQFSSDGDLGLSGGPITLSGNLELLSNNTVTNSRSITLSTTGSIIVDAGSTLTLQGLLSEVPSEPEFPNHAILTDSGSGTLILTNTSNNYSGGTVINGTVSVSDDRQLGASSGNITFGDTFVLSGQIGFYEAGTLITTGNFSSARNITLGSYGGNFTPAAGTTAGFSGVISGGASNEPLIVDGPGTVALFGTNTFAGGVYVSAGGTLSATLDSNLGNTAGGIELNNGTLQWGGVGSSARNVTIDGYGGTINVNYFDTLQLTGQLSGSGTLTKSGPGLLSLATSSGNFSGTTTVASGTVAVGPTISGSTTTPLGTGPVNLAGGELLLHGSFPLSANTQQSLGVTGFNQDVVVERTATAANYQSAVTSAFDTPGSNTTGYAFYENGFNGNSGGLPQNHTFTSANNSAVSFTLQPYAGNNSLQLAGTGVNAAALSLTQPGEFSTVSFLAAASGSVSAIAVLEFSDGSTAPVSETVPDWFSSSPAALVVGSRIGLPDGYIQTVSGYPRLFEFDITVPAADTAKVLTGVNFINEGSDGTLNVFAVSGNGFLLNGSQPYSNAVNVTASSAIVVDGSANATMGALSIGSSTLTVQGPSGGSLSFPSAAVNGNASFDVAPGFTLNLGTVSGGGGVTGTDTGAINYTTNGGTLSSLNVSAGKFTLLGDHSLLVVGSLNLGGTIANPAGLLDLRDNNLVVQNGSLSNITAEIKKGFNNGTWTGTSGITSSTAAYSADPIFALGVYLDSSNLYNASHPFEGYAAATTDVLVKYTYYGDANLDGKVDASDYSLIDSGYVTHATGWQNGDYNYDGVINGSDYTLIDNAFNSQGAPVSAEVAVPTTEVAAVPEPALLSLLTVGGSLLLSRRQRRRALEVRASA